MPEPQRPNLAEALTVFFVPMAIATWLADAHSVPWIAATMVGGLLSLGMVAAAVHFE